MISRFSAKTDRIPPGPNSRASVVRAWIRSSSSDLINLYAAQYADVSWADIYLMRNRVAHGYFSIDFEIAWKTVRLDLPELAARISALLKETP
ncbi:MAG: HepT-like ribonuclease domain-containing protein [Sulfuricaulis sp.]